MPMKKMLCLLMEAVHLCLGEQIPGWESSSLRWFIIAVALMRRVWVRGWRKTLELRVVLPADQFIAPSICGWDAVARSDISSTAPRNPTRRASAATKR